MHLFPTRWPIDASRINSMLSYTEQIEWKRVRLNVVGALSRKC